MHRLAVAHLPTTATLVYSALACQSVFAEDPSRTAAAADSAVQQVQVTAAADDGLADQRSATTARVTVTQAELTKFGDTNLADSMRRVPGLEVVSRQGKTDIRMRGLGNGYTQILINGDSAPPGFAIESLSPSLVERIEVSRVATADQSTQAIAGTINIILRQPPRKATRSIRVTAGGPKGEESYAINGELSGVVNDLSYSLSPSASETNSRTPTTLNQSATDASGFEFLRRHTDQENSLRIDKLEFASALKWKPVDRTVLTLDPWLSLRRIEDRTSDERISTTGVVPTFASDTQFSRINAQLARFRLAWRQQLFDEADLDLKLGMSRFRILGTSHFEGFDENGLRTLNEDIFATTFTRTLTVNGKFRAPVVEGHAMEFGWDGSVTNLSEDRRQFQSAPPGYPAVDLVEINDVRIDKLALFAQDEWAITKELSVYAGVRWETLLTHASGNTISTVDSRSAVLSPIVQMVWRPLEYKDDQLRLGLSRTYKAPTPDQLNPRRHVANDNTPTTPNTSGNPALSPELAWGLDISLEHYLPALDGMVSATAYARSIDDVTVQELSFVDGAWVVRPFNNGKAITTGLELSGKLSLRKLGAEWPQVDLRGNVGWNWSHLSNWPEPGNRMVGQTPFTSSVGIDYQLPTHHLTVGTSLTYSSIRTARASSSLLERRHRSTVWDAYALWKLNQDTQLRIALSNLSRQPTLTDQMNLDASGTFQQRTREERAATVRATLEWKL
ncbi:TonB-dependent receptor [Ideonella sp. 4Y16]|nr:TonB-dependent receptor [Ideonella alba]MBQ0946377.1 TonB-dependent receptor [Ideonella alba]